MLKALARVTLLVMASTITATGAAQDQWPMTIEADGRTITVYQPQPESYKDGRFTGRAAISGAEKGKDLRVRSDLGHGFPGGGS